MKTNSESSAPADEHLLSDDARAIIDAGISAAHRVDASKPLNGEIVEAIESAVGDVFMRYSGSGRSEAAPIEALREIAVLYVHEKMGPLRANRG